MLRVFVSHWKVKKFIVRVHKELASYMCCLHVKFENGCIKKPNTCISNKANAKGKNCQIVLDVLNKITSWNWHQHIVERVIRAVVALPFPPSLDTQDRNPWISFLSMLQKTPTYCVSSKAGFCSTCRRWSTTQTMLDFSNKNKPCAQCCDPSNPPNPTNTETISSQFCFVFYFPCTKMVIMQQFQSLLRSHFSNPWVDKRTCCCLLHRALLFSLQVNLT